MSGLQQERICTARGKMTARLLLDRSRAAYRATSEVLMSTQSSQSPVTANFECSPYRKPINEDTGRRCPEIGIAPLGRQS